MEEGTNRLIATIVDDTPLSRSEVHGDIHQYSVTWTVEYSSVSAVIESDARSFHLRTFPNPSSGAYRLHYQLDRSAIVEVVITDAGGSLISRREPERQRMGEHTMDLNLAGYPNGVYIVQVLVDGMVYQQKVVKRN